MDLVYIQGISKLEHSCWCIQDSMKYGDILRMELRVRLFIRTDHYVRSGLGVNLGMGLTGNRWVTGGLQIVFKDLLNASLNTYSYLLVLYSLMLDQHLSTGF